MRANRTNNKKTQTKHGKNRSISCEKISSKGFEDKFFKNMDNMKMDIKDDFIDPMDGMFGFDDLEEKMFKNFRNDFGLLLDEEKHQKKDNKKSNKKNNIKDGTVFSKVYCSSYNNINGKEHEEKYQSQSLKQINNGRHISECKEAYKNSDGISKIAYQKGLDKKGEKLIREKNTKTGENKEHKILKGIKEEDVKNFEKEYNDYSEKSGFKKNLQCFKALNSSSGKENKKLITDGTQRLNKKTKRH